MSIFRLPLTVQVRSRPTQQVHSTGKSARSNDTADSLLEHLHRRARKVSGVPSNPHSTPYSRAGDIYGDGDRGKNTRLWLYTTPTISIPENEQVLSSRGLQRSRVRTGSGDLPNVLNSRTREPENSVRSTKRPTLSRGRKPHAANEEPLNLVQNLITVPGRHRKLQVALTDSLVEAEKHSCRLVFLYSASSWTFPSSPRSA